MPTVTLIGELFPADPVGVGALLAPMGLTVGPSVPSREWRDLYGALDCAVAAAVHPFYTASIREMQQAGRPVIGSGPVGVEGTAAWLDAIGAAAGDPSTPVREAGSSKTTLDTATEHLRLALKSLGRTPTLPRLFSSERA